MKNIAVLSHQLDGRTPLYPNTPPAAFTPVKSISKGDSSNSFLISISNHSSTHVDAPAHFVEGGKKIKDFSQADLEFGRVAVLQIAKENSGWVEKADIENALDAEGIRQTSLDCIIIRTGFAPSKGGVSPGISPEAITMMRAKFPALRCIGTDSLSVSNPLDRPRGREAHKAAFEERKGMSRPLLLIEHMDLSPLRGKKIISLRLFLWFGGEMDSSPCTAIAELC